MSMIIGRNHSNVRRIELKNADGTTVGSISYTTPSQKKKKRLQYNFKALSAQIMRAKTSGNASQVAAKARREIAMLQRNMKNGEYDEDQIQSAISHAQSLERVARKRVKHLKQEEALKNNENPYLSEMEEAIDEISSEEAEAEEILELSEEELKRLMEELQKAIEEASEAEDIPQRGEESTEIVLEDLNQLELEQLKKKHRADELREIMEADMRYLKAMFNKLAKEKQSISESSHGSSDSSGVSLQLLGLDVPTQTVEIPVAAEGANIDISV